MGVWQRVTSILKSFKLDQMLIQYINNTHGFPYRSAGINGLKSYLGTEKEINFTELNNIISLFKNGADSILLRMGRRI